MVCDFFLLVKVKLKYMWFNARLLAKCLQTGIHWGFSWAICGLVQVEKQQSTDTKERTWGFGFPDPNHIGGGYIR